MNLENFELKNVIARPSRNGSSLYCTVFYKGIEIGSLADKGVGGHVKIDYVGHGRGIFKYFAINNNVIPLMNKDGWNLDEDNNDDMDLAFGFVVDTIFDAQFV